MDTMTDTMGEGSSFFVAEAPDGMPYLGMTLYLPGISMSMVLSDKAGARDMLSQFQRAVNELMSRRPRLLAVSDVALPPVNGDDSA